MRKILPAALAVSAILVTVAVNPADARCFRIGHHLSCFHHRAHYARHTAAYRHAYPWYGVGSGYHASSAAGYGSSYSAAATMGPSPKGGGGP